MGSHYITLDTVILPPPLGALVGLSLVAGAGVISQELLRRLFKGDNTVLDAAACFVAVVSMLAAVSHAVAWIGWHLSALLQMLALTLMVSAMYGIRRIVSAAAPIRGFPADSFRLQTSGSGRGQTAVVCFIFVALAVSALGPATDGDSMDIHIGVPLDWLRAGRAIARPDWLNARTIGLGESLNLLGLAVGSEQVGAIIQAAGMMVAYVAVSAGARSHEGRLSAALLVATCPVLVFLVPNQKPMLIAAASIAVMFALLAEVRKNFDARRVALAAACGAFAVSCKASFVFAAGVGLIAGLFVASTRRQSLRILMATGAATALIAVPSWLRSYLFYGDPISPFFEFLKVHPDPRVLLMTSNLYDSGEPHALLGYLRFALTVAIPTSPGALAVSLGIGTWATAALIGVKGAAHWLAMCAAAIALLEALFSQLSPRFFLDSYLVASMALAASAELGLRRHVNGMLTAQGVVTSLLAGYAAFTLAPGSLSSEWRHTVTNRTADGAEEGRWLDRVLPSDAVINDPFHARGMLPRPFVSLDLPDEDVDQADLERQWQALIRRMQTAGINSIVLDVASYPRSAAVIEAWADTLAGPEDFHIAVRNPFNAGGTRRLQVWRIRSRR